MRSCLLLAALLGASGAGIDVEYGSFDANYMGGDEYYYVVRAFAAAARARAAPAAA
jgi:uncharacterized protein YqfA (UPF0365 family)